MLAMGPNHTGEPRHCQSRDDPERGAMRSTAVLITQDHYGLEDVKERILEHIAVNFLQDWGVNHGVNKM